MKKAKKSIKHGLSYSFALIQQERKIKPKWETIHLSTQTKTYTQQYQMLPWIWEADITQFSHPEQLVRALRRTIVSQSADRPKMHSPTAQICRSRVLQGRNFIAEGMWRNGLGELKYSPTLLTTSTAGKTQHLSRSGFSRETECVFMHQQEVTWNKAKLKR